MSLIEFVNEQEGKDAVAEVRSDASPTDWVLFSYENAKSQKIVLLGKGSGGLTEMVSALKDDIVGYGLIRLTDKIDDSTTVKFVFIMWLPENVPRMQKARISVHQGKMKEWIGQFHTDLNASETSELTHDSLMSKVMDASGSGNRVLDQHGARQTSTTSTATGAKATGVNKAKQGLDWADAAGMKEAIQAVRSDAQPNTWVLFTYDGDDSNTVKLLGTGNGTIDEELIPLLQDNMVGYALVRKVEKIDESETIKFAFIRFVGESVHRMLKARLGTHFGGVTEFFGQYHVSLDVTRTNEISDEIVVKTIRNAAGTSVHVKETVSKPATSTFVPTKAATGTGAKFTAAPSIPKGVPTSDTQAVKLKDEAETKASIKDVRNDATDTNWVLVGYEGGKGNVLITLGKGNGGVEELKSHLADNIVAYGLVRKTERIDESDTVKFAHIVWTGESIDRMHRARLGTHKGAINSLFAPFHVDLSISHLNEISDEIVEQKIGDYSGTKSKVKS